MKVIVRQTSLFIYRQVLIMLEHMLRIVLCCDPHLHGGEEQGALSGKKQCRVA